MGGVQSFLSWFMVQHGLHVDGSVNVSGIWNGIYFSRFFPPFCDWLGFGMGYISRAFSRLFDGEIYHNSNLSHVFLSWFMSNSSWDLKWDIFPTLFPCLIINNRYIIDYLLLIIDYRLWIFDYRWSIINNQSSIIDYWLSIIDYRWSIINNQ